MKLRVLIADDHPIIVRGVRQILAEDFEIESADDAGTTQEVIDKVRENEYDVILMDLSMPGEGGGVAALKQIRKDKPDLPVLIFSMYPEEQYGVQVLKAGAAGYLTKETVPENLTVAVRLVLEGEKYVSETLRKWLDELGVPI